MPLSTATANAPLNSLTVIDVALFSVYLPSRGEKLMEIPLTINQAAALRADIAEIYQLQELHRSALISHQRHRDALARDAGFDPAAIASYEIKEAGGKSYLLATMKELQPD
jgi:hypothetical protein